jgi:hypothetical protein
VKRKAKVKGQKAKVGLTARLLGSKRLTLSSCASDFAREHGDARSDF